MTHPFDETCLQVYPGAITAVSTLILKSMREEPTYRSCSRSPNWRFCTGHNVSTVPVQVEVGVEVVDVPVGLVVGVGVSVGGEVELLEVIPVRFTPTIAKAFSTAQN
jgi:hypothetical protein